MKMLLFIIKVCFIFIIQNFIDKFLGIMKSFQHYHVVVAFLKSSFVERVNKSIILSLEVRVKVV
jgi:hypothetical protein